MALMVVVTAEAVGEGAEVAALASPGATMLDQLRRRMVAGDQDVGEALVVSAAGR